MSNFNVFSIYEVLRIILPGFYLTTGFFRATSTWEIYLVFQFNEFEFGFWYFIISLLVGILIYSIDFPKRFSFLLTKLPTNALCTLHPEIDKSVIYNSYFKFHDSMIGEFKPKMESVSGYFHLAYNLSAVSILLLFITICTKSDYSCMFLIILLLSISSSILLYHLRLKFYYRRSLQAFMASAIYNKINPTTININNYVK